MSQIAVLSDIHGNLVALEAVWADLSKRSGVRVFCLGDLAAFGPEPEACVAFVRDVIRPEAIIRGNTDRYLAEPKSKGAPSDGEVAASLAQCRAALSAESLRYLASLPAEQRVTVDGVALTLVHGAPGNDEAELGPMTAEGSWSEWFDGAQPGATFCGHTHVPFRHRVGQQEIFNVGSVGYPFDGDRRACYLRAMTTPTGLCEAEFRRVSFSTDRVLAQVEASGLAMRETLVRRLRFAVR